MFCLFLLDGCGAGGGSNGGGVDFLLCLDLGLSPVCYFLPCLPDDDLFLFLSAPGEVVGTGGSAVVLVVGYVLIAHTCCVQHTLV